jgi:hypothetical protein
MIAMDAAHLALRNRLLQAVAATTGTTTLGASGSAYTRAAGSFVADGFAVGMEVRAEGFSAANNEPAVVTGVTALELRVDRGLSGQSAAGARAVIAGVPSMREYENAESVSPTPARPYMREEWVPANRRGVTFSGPNVLEEETGLYIVHIYGLRGRGVAALRRVAGAVMAAFRIGLMLSAGSEFIRIRGNPAPWSGRIRPLDSGHAVVVITIPWRAYSRAAA